MKKILIPTTGPTDWKRFLADPDKQWKQGFSAMATAHSWESAGGFPEEIAQLLGTRAELLIAIPEHKVSLPGGSGQSQCDIFALARVEDTTIAVSVEAKVAEPFCPTIGEWLKNASPGKIARLSYVCDKLGLTQPVPHYIRYQLFHRTVAAVIEAERFKTDRAAMIIQSFSQEHRWFEDFEAFCALFGQVAKRSLPIELAISGGRRLTLGWATGAPEFLSPDQT